MYSLLDQVIENNHDPETNTFETTFFTSQIVMVDSLNGTDESKNTIVTIEEFLEMAPNTMTAKLRVFHKLLKQHIARIKRKAKVLYILKDENNNKKLAA